jgi:beta-lactamase class A
MLHRRALLAATPAVLLASGARAVTPRLQAKDLGGELAAIERTSGGKLGVFIIDTGSGRTLAWRATDRFPFCSSFKALLAAKVLATADRGELKLDQRVAYGAADLLSYAPIARKHLAEGAMTLRDLCAAAIEYSDNTAANLLLRETGGPAALTAWMRTTGDTAFQLSHNEPALNLSRFGQARDTTTPQAMARSFQHLALGDGLKPGSRAQLADWLVANTTGANRLRARLPNSWRIGDKTGTWEGGGWASTIDVAIAWPPGGAPLVIAGFVTDTADTAAGERALQAVGQVAAAWRQAHG